MSEDFSQFKRGGAKYPLSTSVANSILEDADPSLFYTLEYFKSVLETYMEPRLLSEVLQLPAIAAISSAVAMVVPYDPVPYLNETQFQFPLLAVYRKKDKFIWKTIGVIDDSSEWAVDYILPPLTAAQMERVGPVLRSVGVILHNRIENMFDPEYREGLEVWKTAGLEEIYLDEATYGGFAGTGNLVFPAWRGKLVVKECDDFSKVTGTADAQLQDLAGIDEETDLVTTGDTTFPDLVDVKKDFP